MSEKGPLDDFLDGIPEYTPYMPKKDEWCRAEEKHYQKFWVTAGGYMLMGLTAFRIRDKMVKSLIFGKNLEDKPEASYNDHAFHIQELQVPDLFVIDGPVNSLTFKKVWWTGNGWMNSKCHMVPGPKVTLVRNDTDETTSGGEGQVPPESIGSV